jgi:hypothetical protein
MFFALRWAWWNPRRNGSQTEASDTFPDGWTVQSCPAAPAKSATNKPFWLLAKGASIAFRYGTEREDEISIRGKSVEFVRVVFCANSDRWGNGQQKKRRIQTTRTSGIFTK